MAPWAGPWPAVPRVSPPTCCASASPKFRSTDSRWSDTPHKVDEGAVDVLRCDRMKVASIGECMIEFSAAGGGLFARGFGGDTLNTALYLSRLGIATSYVTALGDDHLSVTMLAAWRAEGIATDEVMRLPGRVPGLYMIERDARGERSFLYWRDRAPAREFFDRADDG